MAETRVKGRDIGDGTITEVDINLSGSPVMNPISGSSSFLIWDTANNLLKLSSLSIVETYLNTKYSLSSHSHTFDSLLSKPTTLNGYGITDTPWTSYLPLTGGNMSGNIGRSTHSSGHLVGGQNNIENTSTKTNPIYSIGSGYTPTDTLLMDMYGIGYSEGSFWGAGKVDGWGLYVATSGEVKSVIGNGIWTSGDIKGFMGSFGSYVEASTFRMLGRNALAHDGTNFYIGSQTATNYLEGSILVNRGGLVHQNLDGGNIGSYAIQNQNTSAQSANMWISGNVKAGSGIFNNGLNSTDGIKIISTLSSSLFTGGIEFHRNTDAVAGVKIQPERNAAAGGVGLKFLVTANNAAEINGTYDTALTIIPNKSAIFTGSVTAPNFLGLASKASELFHYSFFNGDLNSLNTLNSFKVTQPLSSATNMFPNSNNANSLLSMDMYDGSSTYMAQLGFNYQGDIYSRVGVSMPWNKLYHAGNLNPIQGTLTSGYIPKATGSGTLGNSSIYDDGTNIGIGTNTPGSKLHVVNGFLKVSGSDVDQIFFEGDRIGVATTLRIYDNNAVPFYDSYGSMLFRANQTGGSGGYIGLLGGNVGIGTTNPLYKLDVETLEGDLKVGAANNYSTFGWRNGTGTTVIGSHGAQDWPILFQQNNVTKLYIDSNGDTNIVNNLKTSGNLHLSGRLSIGNDMWHHSVEGDERLYYATSGSTYIKGDGLIFRDRNNSTIGTITNMGDATFPLSVTAPTFNGNLNGNLNGIINRGSNSSISDLNIVQSGTGVFRYDTYDGSALNKPINVDNWNGVISMFSNFDGQYGKQIAFGDTEDLYTRIQVANGFGVWRKLINDNNIYQHAPSLTGVGATGTWGINITGTANDALYVAWSGVMATPDTLAGYGITDSYTKTSIDSSFLPMSYTDIDMDTYPADKSMLLGRNNSGWASGTKPAGTHSGFGVLHVVTHSGSYATQLGFDTNQNKMWVRSRNPSTWTDWKNMWTSDDFANNSTNWNTAFGWGNHASYGYLTSYSETDTLNSVTSRGGFTTNKIGVHQIYGAGTPVVSLSIGDFDTGFNAVSDGITSYVSNGVFRYNMTDVIHAGNYNSYSPTLTGNGASGTWGINVAGSATALTSNQSNWSGTGVLSNVVGLLAWKNYGGGHVIFDASEGLSPSGSVVNNTDTQSIWIPTYPTLMGWNGSNTYGVRVDRARLADTAIYTDSADTSNYAYTAGAADSATLLSSLGSYVWTAAMQPGSFPVGIQNSFVQDSDGFFSYGSVMTMRSYDGSGGGSLQMYTPYSPNYGGTGLKVRFGNYEDSNNWTSWKTLLADDNFNSYSPTLTGTGATGNWNINSVGVVAVIGGSTEVNLVHAQIADNDYFRIRVGGTASNAGWAEIATADDGNEPIYIRQYLGTFGVIARSATLLDESGNTGFPGAVTASSFVGNASSASKLDNPYAYTNGSDGWFRSTGNAGWHNSTHLTGIYSDKAGEVRTYNGANFVSEGNIYAKNMITLGSGSISLPGDSGFWTGYATNSRVSLGALTSGTGYGIFYYQGTAGRDGVDSIDLAFGSTTSATSSHSFKTNGDYKASGDISGITSRFNNHKTNATDGNGYGFWASHASDFGILMSDANNGTYGGRISGDTSSDYNMYFNMAGLNRGYVFKTSGVIHTSIQTNAIRTTGDLIAFSSSDKRLKDNIKPIENAMEKIAKIGGYEFDWNDNQDVYKGHDVGVIAQEVEVVLPEVVTTRKNGYKAVKYEKMIALLIQGMKEQQLEINELKRIINNKN